MKRYVTNGIKFETLEEAKTEARFACTPIYVINTLFEEGE